MNCYYSNLIEGHDTHPVDIEHALQGDYSRHRKNAICKSKPGRILTSNNGRRRRPPGARGHRRRHPRDTLALLRRAPRRPALGRLDRVPPRSGAILEAVLYRGEVQRSDAASLVGTGDRQARRVVSALIESLFRQPRLLAKRQGCSQSEAPRGLGERQYRRRRALFSSRPRTSAFQALVGLHCLLKPQVEGLEGINDATDLHIA
jgi:hypothetical protein